MAGNMTKRRRRKKMEPARDPGFTYHDSWQANGRNIEPGTEVKIRGERGRFAFLRAVENREGVVWLDFVGGKKGVFEWRSFYPDRVKTVHRLKATEKGLLEERRAAQEAAA